MQKEQSKVRVARYNTSKGLQIYLVFKDADSYLGNAKKLSIIVLDDKAYLEPSENGNLMNRKKIAISKKSLIDEFKIFKDGEYPLHYDNEMKTMYIDCREQSEYIVDERFVHKKQKEDNEMNLAGKKNNNSQVSNKGNISSSIVSKQIAQSIDKDIKKNLEETKNKKSVLEVPAMEIREVSKNEIEKEVVPEVIETPEVIKTTTPMITGTDYKSTVIDIMSSWTADLVKNKSFEVAKKLIDITTEIANI